MTSLRPHLDAGYAELLDSFGNVAAEWHDKKYAKAIQNGECSVQRWHQMFHDLAVREAHIILIDGCWIKTPTTGGPIKQTSRYERNAVPKTNPFYSIKEKRYHDNTKCGPGSEIPKHNRRYGTGDRYHCRDCAALNAKGK